MPWPTCIWCGVICYRQGRSVPKMGKGPKLEPETEGEARENQEFMLQLTEKDSQKSLFDAQIIQDEITEGLFRGFLNLCYS